MTRVLRGTFIVWVVLRYGLDELLLNSFQKPWLRVVARLLSIGRRLDAPRGVRLRQALERLGPIFVKFGQVLSTRRDLLPLDVSDELARLQDRVPPFDSAIAIRSIERAFRKPLAEIFASFEREPVASASIAQVHFAVLIDKHGIKHDVAVKVLRPGMLLAIEKDLALMRMMLPGSAACPAMGAGSSRARWWPSSTNTCTTNSTWCAKPPARRSCAATWLGSTWC